MIVKNEGHLIVDTLKHLEKYIKFDYWAINDNGSTDGTQQLIQDYFTEKKIPGVLDNTPWKNFGFNRTVAFNVAYNKTDYVFVWDADDEIAGNFRMPEDLTYDSYKFIFGSGDHFRYSRCQLFNNRKRWCYRGVLHEYAECLEPASKTCDIIGDYHFISGRKGDRSKDPEKYLKDAMVLRKEVDKPDAEKDPLYNRNVFYCAQSYNACNLKEEAITFYKKVTTLETWPQEKYVSCYEIYDQCENLKKPQEGLIYLVESYKFDSQRVECIYRLIKYYCVSGPVEAAYAYYTMIKDFYENKYDPALLGDKLFAKMDEYNFYLPYFMVIVAQRTGHNDTLSKMFEIIVKLGFIAPEWFMRNLMFNIQFAIPYLPKTVEFLQALTDYIDLSRAQGVVYEPAQLQVIGRVIDSYRPVLSTRPAITLPPFKEESRPKKGSVRVMLTITTCKRFDLFEQTVGSLLNTWTDLSKVDYFFCVDDNSTQRDRTKMKTAFPFFDYYMKRKGEKGHRASMNIIYDKLKEVQPTYWIHMEDDWVFFKKDTYVQKSIIFLEKYNSQNIHQILYNRHYGETYDCWETNGGERLEPGFLVHLKSDSIRGRNCGYWPHYSFRPSMVRTKTILELGNYDSPNTFFERDYADRYFAKGYKSGFFNTICSIHTGKLTSDKTGTNAYTLNHMGQFGENASNAKAQSTYVLNLVRRPDRKESVEVAMDAAGIKDNEYEFFEAIDGKELVVTDDIIKLFMGNDFGNRRGIVGCALSHYTLWKQLVADTTNEYYTIFEDDITMVDGFKDKWDSAKATADADMIFLGYHVHDQNKSVITAVVENTMVPLDKHVYIGGFYAYIITKRGAKKLLDYISQNGIRHGIDYLVKIIPDFVSYNCQPHIVLSEWVKSTSSPVDTDIQKDFTSLDIKPVVNKDDWVFYEGVDSGGGDIRGIGHKSVAEIMAEASCNSACVAFNTLGFLKSSVRFPMFPTPYINRPGSGIYVKKEYAQKNTYKIAVYLSGGLGNRIFQTAALLKFAELTGLKPVFNNNVCNTINPSYKKIYKLFPEIEFHELDTSTNCQIIRYDVLRTFMYRDINEYITNRNKNIVVNGWFQSPEYITDSLNMNLGTVPQGTYEKYGLETEEKRLRTWFIHVRLGDYKKADNYNHLNIDTYYRHLVDKIPEGSNVLLFSDEPKLAQSMLNVPGIRVCEETDEIVSLNLMSQCWGGAIVPNSTFSWWGAFLAHKASTRPEGFKAYYPKYWNLNIPEIYPNNCIPSWGIPFENNVKLNVVDMCEWDFYEGFDSGGADLFRTHPSNIDEMKLTAESAVNCVAFNSLGYLKSAVRFPLIKTPWIHAPGGIYVKRGYKPVRRVKMLCNWCSSEALCKEWLKMSKGSYKWNDIEITWSDEDIDYYVIINKPRPEDIEQNKFKPEKTIIFHMEPWCADSSQGWGVKTWGEWAKPDPSKFLQVRSHDKFLNTGFWQVSWTYTDFKTKVIEKSADVSDVVSSICSSKYFDPGHKKRIDFLKYIESRSSGSNDPVKLHIYNEDNQHGFASYQGKAQPSVDKEKGLIPYKYYFMCENNAETNFVTEKIWEPILCEALCFYWGCPNVTDHVDPRAYVVLDMNDFEAAYNTMSAAIKMNLWEERLPYIKAAKQRILDEQSFFPLLEQALKPKTVCFIHSCHLAQAGTEKLDLLLESVCAVKELECITINNIGLPLDLTKYEYMDPRIKVIEASCDPGLFELPTLKLISEYSKANPNAKVLYVHTKGISYAKEDPRYVNGLDWINYMLHFVCKKADNCLKLLDTYDVAGCNFSEHPYHHFSGNFWWATSDHLKGLSLDSLVNKMSAEWWLLSEYKVRSVKATNLWSSGKNHFTERYPVEEYHISKKLVIYTYFPNPSSDYNLDFYSKTAITENANIDYIIVVNGNKCDVTLPNLANLKVIYRDNLGFDFGGHKAALDSLDGKQYDYYFFMNSGVLGPFLPDTHPKDIHWTELFIKKITDKVKLVGTSIYCIPDSHPEYNGPHVEGFCFMTDHIGLKLLLDKNTIFYNHQSKDDAIHYSEYELTECIFKAGYTIDCMLKKYEGVDWLDKQNMHYNSCEPPSRRGKYFGDSIDPFEVIFHKWYWNNPADSMVSFDVVENYVNTWSKKQLLFIEKYMAHIKSMYETLCYTPSDINEHLPTLNRYASECNIIVECGVRSVVSSYAFALALKNRDNTYLYQIDPERSNNVDRFQKLCLDEGIKTEFIEKSDLDCDLINCELLFIDTWHVYGQLKRELARWYSSVSKYIIMHDTTVDEWDGETVRCNLNAELQSTRYGFQIEEIKKGLWPAISEFLIEHPEWKILERYTNNNGLTILKRS